jgi:glutaminase
MLATISSGFLVATTLTVALFQIALALGAPWGAYAYGGARTGKLPVGFRINSVVAAVVMVAISGHYLAQLGVFEPVLDPAGNSVVNWVLVGFTGLAALANNATRSKLERAVWGVPTILMFMAALFVALYL